jgi:peptidyl-prolyl cis-trans isomerase C
MALALMNQRFPGAPSGFQVFLFSKKEISMGRRMWIVAMVVAMGMAGAPAMSQEKAKSAGPSVPKVVAKVNGKAIAGDEFTRVVKQMESGQASRPAGQPAKDPETLKTEVLEHLITMEVLSQKAEQKKIQVGKEDVDKKLVEIQASMGGEPAFNDAMKTYNITLEQFRTDVGRSLRIQQLVDQEVFEKIVVEPAEVNSFYESNPKAFDVPEQVRARHIIVRFKEGATDADKKEARAAIDKAAERLKKGEDFEAVAKEVSQDGTASNGGDLGYFGRGQMVPEFDTVAFSMEKGKVSAVVETRFGFHLIKVEDKREPRKLTVQEVGPRIVEFLKQKKGQEGLKKYVDDLRAQAKIEKTKF